MPQFLRAGSETLAPDGCPQQGLALSQQRQTNSPAELNLSQTGCCAFRSRNIGARSYPGVREHWRTSAQPGDGRPVAATRNDALLPPDDRVLAEVVAEKDLMTAWIASKTVLSMLPRSLPAGYRSVS